jgi:branched-chain amino acid transport system ATP-binding protein
MPPLLEAEDLHGITTILGANGAGKTTTLRAVCGMVRTAGVVRFAGQRIDGKAPEDIVRLGIAHVPEGRGTFVNLTVEENLRVGAYARRDRAAFRRDLDRVYQYFPILRERHRQLAGTLSGGEQQLLAIGRALVQRPVLLMLDEPSVGLAPRMVAVVLELVARIRARGVSVLLVEQNVRQALACADRGYVLESGRIVLEGPARGLVDHPVVRRAYLGL